MDVIAATRMCKHQLKLDPYRRYCPRFRISSKFRIGSTPGEPRRPMILSISLDFIGWISEIRDSEQWPRFIANDRHKEKLGSRSVALFVLTPCRDRGGSRWVNAIRQSRCQRDAFHKERAQKKLEGEAIEG